MSDLEPGVTQPKTKPLLRASVITYHPEKYTLIDGDTGQRWALNEKAEWVAAPEPTYQYQVFDTRRSRVVLDVPAEDVADMRNAVLQPHWTIRRRVVGPWEEVN